MFSLARFALSSPLVVALLADDARCDSTDGLPTTMNAIVQAATYGDPKDVLEFRADYPMPPFDPEGSALLVKVHAAAINPIDYKIIEGFMAAVKPTKFPFIPGSDMSGVVVRTGAKYKGDLQPGDKVWT